MKAKQDKKQPRNRYSPEFKKQALDRADKEGVATVSRDLGLAESQLYTWRQQRRLDGLTTEEQKLQQAELARLKRDMARLEEENALRQGCPQIQGDDPFQPHTAGCKEPAGAGLHGDRSEPEMGERHYLHPDR